MSGLSGVYTLDSRIGENIWFDPMGKRIVNTPVNAALLLNIKALATSDNEITCSQNAIVMSGAGRFYGNRNQWTGFNYTYGPTYYQFNQSYGSGVLPAPNTNTALGHTVARSGMLDKLVLNFRRSGVEAVPLDWRVMLVRAGVLSDLGGITDTQYNTINRTIELALASTLQAGDQVLLSIRKNGGTAAVIYAYASWAFLLTYAT